MRITSAAALSLAFVLAGCGFEGPAPKLTPPAPAPPALLSTLDAELRLPAADIARLLNDKTQTEIAHLDDKSIRCPLGKCQVSLVARRNGPITVAVETDRISLTLPFDIDSRFRFKLPFVKSGGEAHGTGVIFASTAFSVTQDWELRSRTEGHIEFSHAQVKIGPVRSEVRDLLNDETDEIARPVFREVDSQLPKWAALEKRMAQLWTKVHAPIRVGKNPPAWLELSPRRIFLAPPHGEGGALVLAVRLQTQASVIVGERPNAVLVPPLPAPEPMHDEPQGRFHLLVPALLPYDEAARLAMAEIAKHPITVGKSTRVAISDLAILPSRDDVVVSARFCLSQGWDPFGWFDACGRGYLRGAPVFDPATGQLRITKIAYDVQSADALVGAARLLLGADLASQLEQRLVFDLSGEIGKLKDQVSKALSKGEGEELSVSGQMESFGAPTLSWTKDGFVAAFSAEGTIQLAFQP